MEGQEVAREVLPKRGLVYQVKAYIVEVENLHIWLIPDH